LVIALATGAYLAFSWSDLPVLQRLLIASFISILLHQFEEYGFPGGEPAIMNMVLQPSPTPERYPLNQNSALVTNVLCAYVFCLVPVFFPHVIWLGLAPMLSWFGQFIVHGIATNRKLKSLYNPGLGVVVFIQIPLAFYYIYYIQSHSLASVWDWVFAIVYLALYMSICLYKLTYSWLAKKNSPYPFAEVEMRRFHVQQKIEKLNIEQAQ
jgi:hypothetical protein